MEAAGKSRSRYHLGALCSKGFESPSWQLPVDTGCIPDLRMLWFYIENIDTPVKTKSI
jgi:hypothetical protein